jgi:hypothetical protein
MAVSRPDAASSSATPHKTFLDFAPSKPVDVIYHLKPRELFCPKNKKA